MNQSNLVVRQLSIDDLLGQLNLLQLLTPKLTQESVLQMLPSMFAGGYRAIGIFENDHCLGLSGYWVQTKLYCGKYLELDNVVVNPKFRSMGIGKILVQELEKIAIHEACKVMMLDAYLENTKAHEFYSREGFTAKGYHFIKKLN
jgi:ribosomal protein S18 acetylase RimI-like enzyme